MNFGARLKEALLHWSVTLAAYLMASVSILIGGIERDQGDLVIGTVLVMIMFLLDLAWSFRQGWTTKLILSVVAMNVWGTLYFGVVYTARDHPKVAVAEATTPVSSENSAPGKIHPITKSAAVWFGLANLDFDNISDTEILQGITGKIAEAVVLAILIYGLLQARVPD